jgi:tetratricopeptide (TPR) repeat protein
MGPTSAANDPVRRAMDLMARGDFVAARDPLELAIVVDPKNAQLHWQLGVCHAGSNHLNLAHDCFREAIRLDPSFAHAHASLGAWYLIFGMVELALQSSAKAFALCPSDSRIIQSHARILEAAGQMEPAWQLAQQLIDRKLITAGTLRLYGRMARYRHQQPTALALTEQLLAANSLSVNERAGLHFTAADLLDSLQQYDQAFAHADAGNRISRPRYDPASHQRTFDKFVDYFTAEQLGRLARSEETTGKPVLIVGMPRSGTSLIEQILASHPDIHGAGELDFMEHIFHGTLAMLSAKAADYPQCLDRLTTEQATGMAQIYLQPLTALGPSAIRITDKLPLNFLHLGLIQILLPGARIIHCRRDAMDTCLSCHMHSFASGNDFKFDLTHLGLFHRQYQRLMVHWTSSLDLPMLQMNYEDIVTDPEGQTRRMLDFLDLPFDPACLDFHRTQRPVLTSSIQQVRQPLYGSAVHRWKHYEKHLAPLKLALGLS